ncbi:hypothetical protein RUM43_007825 [Polyplax serrata]|uniref:polyribonucleotide nucleotidyltransferase n=1 Tax=Polyplax serrata TaxID=468196 RepID=A0AAN8PNA2_POLSC
MAIIFQKAPRLSRYQHFATNLWLDVKRKRFRMFTTQFDSVEPEEVLCEIQKKPDIEEHTVVANTSNGNITISAGKLAKFADGCARVTLNDTTVMATAVSKEKANAQSGFVPLTVVYQQKAAALGRIPLNFLRRELGQNENEILTARMIDRSLRPLFPQHFNWDTQIICNPLAMDGNNFPDVLSINAASAALAISDIPWMGPVGAVRVAYINDEVITNPNKKQLSESEINLIVVAVNRSNIVMLEGSCNILLNGLLKVIKHGVKECQFIVKAIEQLQKKCGKPKRLFAKPEIDMQLYNEIKFLSIDGLHEIFTDESHDKLSRDNAISNLCKTVLEQVNEKFENTNGASEMFAQICKSAFRDLIFEKNLRCDGRTLSMLRNINSEVNLFKPLHGSALFQRGQTQVLCTVALDSPNSAMRMDRISMLSSGLKEKNFFVHYEFPPFATKEVGRLGPVGRREIGHGSLAEKALKVIVPDNFPFTIRLTSEVLESNGSSSMATVCGGTLALLDAGVPIKSSCAGVAMGIITKWSEGDESQSEITDYRILTDLLGIEDYMGDMDFKIAGTFRKITALQMDIKVRGLPAKIVMETLTQAKGALTTILMEMNKTCAAPRKFFKGNQPVMEKVTVPVHLRSRFIGPGGTNVKKLEMDAGVEITEETVGEFIIFAPNKSALKEATQIIQEIIESHKEPQLEFGGVYTATIVEIKEHGCMVTLYPNMQPVLIHMSQLDQRNVSHPSALGMEVGHQFQVKYFGRDPVSGMMRLSRKVLQATAQVIQNHFKKVTTVNGDDSVKGN